MGAWVAQEHIRVVVQGEEWVVVGGLDSVTPGAPLPSAEDVLVMMPGAHSLALAFQDRLSLLPGNHQYDIEFQDTLSLLPGNHQLGIPD